MKLEVIKIKDLTSFINSTLYKNSYHIPITQLRAISQQNNPRANLNDVALIVAVNKNNQIIGYIGALPEKAAKNIDIKLAWSSCWWVDPVEGKQVAIPLLLKLFSSYNNNIIFRDLTARTKKIILKLNKFYIAKPLLGFRFFIRVESEKVLLNKYQNLKSFKIIFRLIDFCINNIAASYFKFRSFIFLKLNKCKVEFIDVLDSESEQFIEKHNKNELFKRGKSEIDWIIKYPWVNEKQDENLTKRYYFTSGSSSFKNYLVKIYNEKNKIVGVLFMNEINGLVKIPYAYFKDEYPKHVLSFIYKFLIEKKASSFVTFNSEILKEISNKNGMFLFKKKLTAEFVVPNSFKENTNWNFDFQDGEGDFVFT